MELRRGVQAPVPSENKGPTACPKVGLECPMGNKAHLIEAERPILGLPGGTP